MRRTTAFDVRCRQRRGEVTARTPAGFDPRLTAVQPQKPEVLLADPWNQIDREAEKTLVKGTPRLKGR